MQFQNETRSKIAVLAALTLLFSYAEMLLPRIVPFFRLGLGNIAILAAFQLSFPAFLVLTALKALASALMSGTLFSPFVLISLAQSIFSGIFMFGLFHLNRLSKKCLLSIYGISLAGSAVSAFIQIALSSIYLGSGTSKLLGPMLIFNSISGIFTAFLYDFLKLSDLFCNYNSEEFEGESLPLSPSTEVSPGSTSAYSATPSNGAHPRNAPKGQLIFAILILIFAATVFFIDNIFILIPALFMSFIAQAFCKRKILLIPHISLWLFVILSSLLVPEGKILFKIWNFSITQDALLLGIKKALKLSAVSALSQCAAGIRPSEETLLGKTLACYRLLSDTFRNSPGSVLQKLKTTLNSLQTFLI